METIQPNAQGLSFAFWGHEGRIVLPPDVLEVVLTYEYEPPHGDFMYTLSIAGKVLKDGRDLRLFWGRNILVSPCGRYLAITEGLKEMRYTVFSLGENQEWSRRGFIKLVSLVFPTLKFQEYVSSGLHVVPGPLVEVDLQKSGGWKAII